MSTRHHSAPRAAAWPESMAQAAVHASQELLLALDDAGTIRLANPAAQQTLNSRPDQLIGRRFLQLLDEGSRAKGRRLLEQADEAPSAVFELNQVDPHGTIVMIGYRALRLSTPPLDQPDEPTLLLIGQPLERTVATTERLIALNQRLSALFTVAASASRSLVLTQILHQALDVALSELDLRAGAIWLIDSPVELSGAPQPATPAQLRLVAQRGFAPAFIARLAQPEAIGRFWQRYLREDAPQVQSGSGADLEIEPQDLSLTTGPLLTVATTPLLSENQLLGWLYLLTDRYNALHGDDVELLRTIGNLLGPPVANARLHDALLQTSGQLQAVLDGIDSGVLLVDQEGIVRYANRRLGALLGSDVAGWPDQPRAAVLPPTLVPLPQPTPLFTGELWELPGPPRRILRRYADTVQNAAGAPLGAIEVYTDVTALEEMNRLKDEFVAAAAHDLKTPVTAIKGYAQIALRMARRMNEERLTQQLAMINARSDELTALMDALLDMSRIQAGRMVLDLDRFPLSELLASVLGHFEFDLRRRNREVTIYQPPTPVEVVWDRVRTQAVLINLIGNALKYSPAGGPIALRVELCADPADWIAITVTDHGIGIPAAERALIFDRFYRTRETVEHGFKGTGIGLYIARHVVELHGGRIWAGDALHGGPGTTLHLLLPRVCVGEETV